MRKKDRNVVICFTQLNDIITSTFRGKFCYFLRLLSDKRLTVQCNAMIRVILVLKQIEQKKGNQGERKET